MLNIVVLIFLLWISRKLVCYISKFKHFLIDDYLCIFKNKTMNVIRNMFIQ